MTGENVQNRLKKNAYFVALYLFQYSLLIPLMGIISPTVVVLISGMLILVGVFLTNSIRKVNIQPMIITFTMLTVLLCNTLFTEGSVIGIVYFIMIILPIMFLFFFDFNIHEFLKKCTDLAVISFFLIFWNPFTSHYVYMRFGYGMLTVVIFLYIRIVYDQIILEKQSVFNRVLSIALLCVGTVELLVYGSRGGILSLVIFIFMDRVIINRKKIVKNMCLIIAALIAYFNIVKILTFFENLSKKVGIYSYSITKLRMQLEIGFSGASSGRDKLYSYAMERISSHPFLGNGITAVEEGQDYVHNIFLQVAMDLGVFALIVLILILVAIIVRIFMKNVSVYEKIILTALFSISIGRLLFSSTLWRRPEFWVMIIFFFTYRNKYYNGTE